MPTFLPSRTLGIEAACTSVGLLMSREVQECLAGSESKGTHISKRPHARKFYEASAVQGPFAKRPLFLLERFACQVSMPGAGKHAHA